MVRAWAHEAFAYAMSLMLPFGCWIVTAAAGTYCGDASYPVSMHATQSTVTELGGHRCLNDTTVCSTATCMLVLEDMHMLCGVNTWVTTVR